MPRPILSSILAVTLVATLGIADNSIPNASAAMRSDGVSVVDVAQDANGEPLAPPTPVGQEAQSVNESVGLPTAADVAPVVSDGRALLELTGKPATAAKDAPITFAQPAKVGIGERPSSTMSVLILGSDRVRGLDLVAFGFQLTDIPTDAADARIPTVAVSVDYSAFSDLYGASFGSRLQLVRYPACVLTTPKESACVTPTVVASMVNNAEGGVVEGTITLGEPTSREVPPSGGDAAVGPLGGPSRSCRCRYREIRRAMGKGWILYR